MAAVTATSTDTRTPPRHDCRHVSTSGRHVPHVLTSYTACRQRSNFHGNTSGRSSDTNTYHQRQTRHNHNRNTPEHVTTSNCRTRHTSTSTTRGHAATLRTSGNCRATMERQHVTTSTGPDHIRPYSWPHRAHVMTSIKNVRGRFSTSRPARWNGSTRPHVPTSTRPQLQRQHLPRPDTSTFHAIHGHNGRGHGHTSTTAKKKPLTAFFRRGLFLYSVTSFTISSAVFPSLAFRCFALASDRFTSVMCFSAS